MGRTKTLSDSKGHLTKVTQITKAQQEDAISDLERMDLERPPAELRDAYARKTWKRIIPKLLQLPVLCDLDRDNLISYCNVWSEYVELIEEQKRAESIDDIVTRVMVLDKLSTRIQKVQDAHRKYGSLCGMSIDSRLKMAATKQKKEAEQVDQTFGVI